MENNILTKAMKNLHYKMLRLNIDIYLQNRKYVKLLHYSNQVRMVPKLVTLAISRF